jgi:hypothetical protein
MGPEVAPRGTPQVCFGLETVGAFGRTMDNRVISGSIAGSVQRNASNFQIMRQFDNFYATKWVMKWKMSDCFAQWS